MDQDMTGKLVLYLRRLQPDLPDLHFPQFDFLERALIVAQSVPAGQIASTTALRFPGKAHRIPTEIHAARIRAVHAIVASE